MRIHAAANGGLHDCGLLDGISWEIPPRQQHQEAQAGTRKVLLLKPRREEDGSEGRDPHCLSTVLRGAEEECRPRRPSLRKVALTHARRRACSRRYGTRPRVSTLCPRPPGPSAGLAPRGNAALCISADGGAKAGGRVPRPFPGNESPAWTTAAVPGGLHADAALSERDERLRFVGTRHSLAPQVREST